jgi:hypothetical protein
LGTEVCFSRLLSTGYLESCGTGPVSTKHVSVRGSDPAVVTYLFIDLRNKVLDAVLRSRHGCDVEL